MCKSSTPCMPWIRGEYLVSFTTAFSMSGSLASLKWADERASERCLCRSWARWASGGVFTRSLAHPKRCFTTSIIRYNMTSTWFSSPTRCVNARYSCAILDTSRHAKSESKSSNTYVSTQRIWYFYALQFRGKQREGPWWITVGEVVGVRSLLWLLGSYD